MTDGPSVVIAGGGTGGHLMPGLAVAQELRRSSARVLFVGTARGLESRLVPEAGYELRLIGIAGLKGRGWGQRLGTLGRLPFAVAQSVGILRRAGAKVVFGIGGYASGPVLAAAALMRIPVVVLEVNAKTGLANRLAARWVKAAAVNFPETGKNFSGARVEVTGIPVREAFFAATTAATLPGPPLVLVFGGSQGAHALNQVVSELVRSDQLPVRWRHQTGAADYAAIAAAYEPLGERVRAETFIGDMPEAMAAAEVVVCRAGASTLGEIAAAGRAAILVPFPAAADQHQLCNAQAFARAGAAVLLEQRTLTSATLAEAITKLLNDGGLRQAMAKAARGFAHPRAAEQIAALILAAASKPT
jgi:UDP-N-acetylglucosamine--N-acetylmuramyl-(pentapeptide) pyrophosphoryl-undecaprenol N-acetylglucosamine transferase